MIEDRTVWNYLKSSLDRFIGVYLTPLLMKILNLKSSLDRFIVENFIAKKKLE